MILADWLARFAAGAAQFPGWQLAEQKLRRLGGRVQAGWVAAARAIRQCVWEDMSHV